MGFTLENRELMMITYVNTTQHHFDPTFSKLFLPSLAKGHKAIMITLGLFQSFLRGPNVGVGFLKA